MCYANAGFVRVREIKIGQGIVREIGKNNKKSGKLMIFNAFSNDIEWQFLKNFGLRPISFSLTSNTTYNCLIWPIVTKC